ncbi:hypothetical protein MNBD_NITROSPINAE03-305, partial [hydrothermal vent metagenome]
SPGNIWRRRGEIGLLYLIDSRLYVSYRQGNVQTMVAMTLVHRLFGLNRKSDRVTSIAYSFKTHMVRINTEDACFSSAIANE